jgi:hypothetical protein
MIAGGAGGGALLLTAVALFMYRRRSKRQSDGELPQFSNNSKPCPHVCRQALPALLANVRVQLRDLMQRVYPECRYRPAVGWFGLRQTQQRGLRTAGLLLSAEGCTDAMWTHSCSVRTPSKRGRIM